MAFLNEGLKKGLPISLFVLKLFEKVTFATEFRRASSRRGRRKPGPETQEWQHFGTVLARGAGTNMDYGDN